MSRLRLYDLFRFYKALPHQSAAIAELEEALLKADPTLLDRDQPWFKTWSQSGKQPEPQAPPIWLEPARKIVAQWEGLRTSPYLCASGVPTIGYGRTGPDVHLGMAPITKAQAEAWLDEDLRYFAEGVHRLLPGSHQWGANQQAALISWCMNVGLGAAEQSTLRARLLRGEPGIIVVPQELPRWNKGDGGKELPGLTNRRAAEVALFTGRPPAPAPSADGVRLKVPYYSQRDSAMSGQAQRMCFSSSCAMLLSTLRPGAIGGPNADDQYLKRVLQYGDTTDAAAQVKALASYGVKAKFVQNATFATLEHQLKAGVPVPCGFLHHGPSHSPRGGGHWLTVIGYTPEAFVVNDPWGEMDVAKGGYLNSNGAGLSYSRKNWGPRWLADGPGSGWAIIATA
jgi:GH24 family phage-related lysozyme (muramidase)